MLDHFHNILRLFYVVPNFLSPQVKRWAIITYEHGIYELPLELPNELSLRILGNYKIIVSGNIFLILTRPRPLQT